MTKLFVCEKPAAVNCITFLFEKNDNAIVIGNIAPFKFDYQDIKFSKAPYTREIPQYKPNPYYQEPNFFHDGLYGKDYRFGRGYKTDRFLNEYYFKKDTYGYEKNKEEILKFFSKYEEIIYFCSNDYSSYRSFDFRFSKYFGLGENWLEILNENNIKVSFVKVTAFYKEGIQKDFDERTDFNNNPNVFKLKESYMKKDYFEYNYNLNSILFFNEILDKIGHVKSDKDTTLTKNYILFLYLLSKQSYNFNELHTLRDTYYIGSISSFEYRFEKMIDMGLLTVDNKVYSITKKGLDFLTYLHKKIYDPYLNQRIISNNKDEDCYKDIKDDYLNLEDFKVKYEAYLYRTFSKQKRFSRKNEDK